MRVDSIYHEIELDDIKSNLNFSYVSNWIRFVSTDTSGVDFSADGLGRIGGGASSSGLGCIKINGSSATRSLYMKKTIHVQFVQKNFMGLLLIVYLPAQSS